MARRRPPCRGASVRLTSGQAAARSAAASTHTTSRSAPSRAYRRHPPCLPPLPPPLRQNRQVAAVGHRARSPPCTPCHSVHAAEPAGTSCTTGPYAGESSPPPKEATSPSLPPPTQLYLHATLLPPPPLPAPLKAPLHTIPLSPPTPLKVGPT